MPELPEVETVLTGLRPHLEGKRIEHAIQRRKDLRWPLPPRFAQRLSGRRIETMTRRAKYLLFGLDPAPPTPKADPVAETLIIHLGMSGRLFVEEKPAVEEKPGVVEMPGIEDRANTAAFHHALGETDKARKHDHIVLEMEHGAQIIYNDARRFGAMDLWPTESIAEHKLLRSLGIEPMSKALDGAWMLAQFEGKKANLKAALLDQRLIAGLGNIYVCEALFRARLNPEREAGALTPSEASALAKAVKTVLGDAIKAGGSSLRDFHGASGELGYFQHSFNVYGRGDMPCLRARCTGWVRRTAHSGRSTFSCELCQV